MSKGKEWYFFGADYDGNKRSDPLTFTFYRGAGPKSPGRVGAHVTEEWRYGAMRDRDCRSPHTLTWRNLRGGSNKDKNDLERSTACNTRFHMRAWDDFEHQKLAPDHGNRRQWMIGSVHHEHYVVKTKCYGITTPVCTVKRKHKIDRDWDAVRIQTVKAMSAHCSYRRWRMHPGAKGDFGGQDSSGYIARLSMRHAPGCRGS